MKKKWLTKLICVIMLMVSGVSAAVPSVAGDSIEQTMLEYMQEFKEIYEKDKDGFPEIYMFFMYEAYQLYQSANGLQMVENVLSGASTAELYKTVRRGSIGLSSILDDIWGKWLNGEASKQEAMDILMIMVDSTLRAHEDAGKK